MSKVTVKVEGLKELDAALGELSKGAARGVLRRVLIKAAQPMADKAEQLAPDDPDGPAADLKQSIRISAKLKNKTGNAEFHAAMKAGLGKAAAVDAMRDARRASGEDSFAIIYVGPEAGRNSNVGALQEFGPKHHPAHPFMRPAWDQHKEDALKIISSELGDEIAKSAARAKKRAARKPGGGKR